MTDAGFFRGTSSEQDNRFSDKEKKLLKQMKFADSLLKKVDMSKVNLNVLKPWISDRISELLGMEDDVLNEFVFNQLEADNNPDGRRIQINLTGFLNGKNARVFMGELWDMLLDAMENQGVPTAILDAKKSEISERIKQEQQDDQQKHQKVFESTLRNQDDDRRGGYHGKHNERGGDGDRSRHSYQSSKPDESRSRRRFDDNADRDRERDRDRDRDRPHAPKRSRFSGTHNEPEPIRSSRDEPPRESSRHAEPVFEEKTVKRLEKYDDEDAPKVEMKKHKKSKHRHHRKRRSSSSGGSSHSDDDEDNGYDRREKSKKGEKKKKKKSKRKHTSRSRSRDRSVELDKNLEQELRDRALESMRRQKDVRK